jgi:hypothetical protein
MPRIPTAEKIVRAAAAKAEAVRENIVRKAAARRIWRAFAAVPLAMATAVFPAPQEDAASVPSVHEVALAASAAVKLPGDGSGASDAYAAMSLRAVPAAGAPGAAFTAALAALVPAADIPVPAAVAFTPAAPAAGNAEREAAAPADKNQALQKELRVWIDALAKQEPFRRWSGAEIRLDPLGPGTHGWLATLTDPDVGEPVGYLVVYAEDGPEGGYRLGEYGLGSYPLFAEPVALRTLRENGYLPPSGEYAMTRVYRHPLAAAWKVRVNDSLYWLDAKTGEELPLDERAWERAAQAQAQIPPAEPGETVSGVRLNESFDPYERLPWLMGEAALPADSAEPILKRLRGGLHVRFVSEPFGDPVLYALPIIGYVAWSGGRVDLAFDQNGPRFVPLVLMRELGKFYK